MNFEFVLQYFYDLNPPSRPPPKEKKTSLAHRKEQNLLAK